MVIGGILLSGVISIESSHFIRFHKTITNKNVKSCKIKVRFMLSASQATLLRHQRGSVQPHSLRIKWTVVWQTWITSKNQTKVTVWISASLKYRACLVKVQALWIEDRRPKKSISKRLITNSNIRSRRFRMRDKLSPETTQELIWTHWHMALALSTRLISKPIRDYKQCQNRILFKEITLRARLKPHQVMLSGNSKSNLTVIFPETKPLNHLLNITWNRLPANKWHTQR